MNCYKKIRISRDKTVDEHRLIMEKKAGRKLNFNEIVHHINEQKTDNSTDNLEIKSRSDHSREHMLSPEINSKLIERATGEKNVNAKLAKHSVVLARLLRRVGVSVSEVARIFQVDRKTAREAISGKTWGHIKILLPYPPAIEIIKKSKDLTIK